MKFDAGSKAERHIKTFVPWNDGVMKRVRYIFPFHKVYADGSESNDGDGDEKVPQISFEDLIAKARKEEKDKLYPQLNDLKDKNKVLTETNNTHLLSIATLEKKVQELTADLAKAGKNDPEEVAGLKAKLSDALALIQTLQGKVDAHKDIDEATIRSEIEAEVEARYEVKIYRLQKIQEAGDDILIPELVVGDSKEAIDASITAAKARTSELKAKLGIKDNKDTKLPPKKPSNPSNPPDKGGQVNGFDFDYVSKLNPASKEYREWREKVGLK